MASLISNLLWQTALAKSAKTVSHLASSVVCELVNSVEFDCGDRISILVFFQEMCWVEVQHQVLWIFLERLL